VARLLVCPTKMATKLLMLMDL